MEPKGEMPDFRNEPGQPEFDLGYKAADSIWIGINAYWGDDYVETTSYREGINMTQTRQNEDGLVSYELQAGYITDEDDEEYEGEEPIFIGNLSISECKDENDLTEGLKALHMNSVVELKKSQGRTEDELELDTEIREIKYQQYYAWEVSEYTFGVDANDSVQVRRGFQLRNALDEVVWSSRFDEEPDEPIITELNSQDSKLTSTLTKDDYFNIQYALVILLNISPEVLERRQAA